MEIFVKMTPQKIKEKQVMNEFFDEIFSIHPQSEWVFHNCGLHINLSKGISFCLSKKKIHIDVTVLAISVELKCEASKI